MLSVPSGAGLRATSPAAGRVMCTRRSTRRGRPRGLRGAPRRALEYHRVVYQPVESHQAQIRFPRDDQRAPRPVVRFSEPCPPFFGTVGLIAWGAALA